MSKRSRIIPLHPAVPGVLICLVLLGWTGLAPAQNPPRILQRPDSGQQQVTELQKQLQRAHLLERQGRLEEAAAIYRQLYQDHQDNPSIYTRYLQVVMQLGDYSMAEYLITNQLKKHPEDVNSLVSLGTVYYHQHDKDKALRQWKSVLDEIGRNTETYYQIINTMFREGLFREATDLINDARQHLGQPAFLAGQMATVYASRMDYRKAAEEYLLYYLHDNRNEASLVMYLSRFPDEPEVFNQVKPVLKQAILDHPKDAQLVRVLADYLYRIQDFRGALEQYRRLEQMEGAPGKYREKVAYQLLNDGQYQLAMQLYESLLGDTDLPRSELQFGYAEAGFRRMLDRYTRDDYEMPFRKNSLWELNFVIVPDEAGPDLSRILSDYQFVSEMLPGTPASQISDFRLGEIYLRLGNDFDRALQAFTKCAADTSHPRQTEARMDIAFCYLAKGDLKQARQHWESVLPDIPRGKQSLANTIRLQIAGTYFYQGDLDEGIARLDDVREQTSISSDLYNDILEVQTLIGTALKDKTPADTTTLQQFFRAEFYVRQHKITQAQKAHLHILDLDKQAPIAPYALLRTAQLGDLLGQTEQSIEWLTQLINNYPDAKLGDQAMFMLAKIYENQQQYADAIHWYEQILIEYPGSILEQQARKTLRELQQKTS